jgi:hypothetical protein
VHLASGIPCALFYWAYEKFQQNSGARRREIAKARLLPSRPRAKRVAGRGRGWGVLQRTHSKFDSRRDPHPRPLPTTRKGASGEGRRIGCLKIRKSTFDVVPASAGIRVHVAAVTPTRGIGSAIR